MRFSSSSFSSVWLLLHIPLWAASSGNQPAVAGDEPRRHAAGLCAPSVSLAEEADARMKPSLEPLLVVPSQAASLLPYRTNTHVLHTPVCECALVSPSVRITSSRKHTTLHLIQHWYSCVVLCHQVFHREVQWPREVLLHRDHFRVADDGAFAGPRGGRLAQHHCPRHGDEYVMETHTNTHTQRWETCTSHFCFDRVLRLDVFLTEILF